MSDFALLLNTCSNSKLSSLPAKLRSVSRRRRKVLLIQRLSKRLAKFQGARITLETRTELLNEIDRFFVSMMPRVNHLQLFEVTVKE